MKKVFITALTFLTVFFITDLSGQCHKKKVGSYYKSHDDIVDIAISSDIHKTLVAAVKAADLVSTLKSDGPFTVFAPTDFAFEKLPNGTVETLLQAKNKKSLVEVLTYHVIPASVSSKSLLSAIEASGGEFEIKTIQGDILIATIKAGHPVLIDKNGGVAKITDTDLRGSNGYVHVIDSVVLPN